MTATIATRKQSENKKRKSANSTGSSGSGTQSWFGSKKNLPHSVGERKLLVDSNHETITLSRQAELLDISRGSLYTEPTPFSVDDLALHHALDRLYTDCPFFGQRRLAMELGRQYGIDAGRDRIRSAMAFLGLETLYPKPKTSTPHPNHRLYPYLLRNIPAEYPNHIWSIDITYIALTNGYCYLVALLDWYSRYVLSWRVAESMENAFCIDALNEALSHAVPLFHNSDQGSQFTSNDYLDVLAAYPDIRISMDGRGRCLDNIFVERLWRSVKYENVYLNEYATAGEVRDGIEKYFRFYNEKRPHQSLGYKLPQKIYHQKDR